MVWLTGTSDPGRRYPPGRRHRRRRGCPPCSRRGVAVAVAAAAAAAAGAAQARTWGSSGRARRTLGAGPGDAAGARVRQRVF